MAPRLGSCTTCGDESKYRCPKCEEVSCSLKCVKEHKEVNKCDGKRDRTSFVAKENMDNLTTLNDYRFLEEIDHKLDDGLRNPLRRSIIPVQPGFELPPHLKKLRYEAYQRGTNLEFMPQPFSKHTKNTSWFDFRENVVKWHVTWVFPHADCTFFDERIHEDTTLTSLLRRYLEPLHRLDLNDSQEINNPLSTEDSEKLAYYQSASLNRIAVLLKTERCKYDPPFIEMFPSKSLKLNLNGRKIVEHPTFYVVLRDHLEAFIDEDEDLKMKELALNNCSSTDYNDREVKTEGIRDEINSNECSGSNNFGDMNGSNTNKNSLDLDDSSRLKPEYQNEMARTNDGNYTRREEFNNEENTQHFSNRGSTDNFGGRGRWNSFESRGRRFNGRRGSFDMRGRGHRGRQDSFNASGRGGRGSRGNFDRRGRRGRGSRGNFDMRGNGRRGTFDTNNRQERSERGSYDENRDRRGSYEGSRESRDRRGSYNGSREGRGRGGSYEERDGLDNFNSNDKRRATPDSKREVLCNVKNEGDNSNKLPKVSIGKDNSLGFFDAEYTD